MVTIVLNVVPDDVSIGGVHVRALAVAQELRRVGIETIFLSAYSFGDKPFSKKARSAGFRCFHYIGINRPSSFRNAKTIFKNLLYVLFFPISIVSSLYIMLISKANVVHINGFLNIVPLISAKIFRKKTVYHLIGDHYPTYIVKRLGFFLKISDENVFIANSLKEYYSAGKSLKGKTIYEPIPKNNFKIDNYKIKNIKQEFNILDYDYIVGNVANYTPVKGWEYFIDIANKVQNELKTQKILFICIGSVVNNHLNYYLDVVERSNKTNTQFVFTGYREDVIELISIMDVFLMPSLKEGTPITILESFLAETPVVASNVGGIKEQIENGINGYIVEPRNIDEFAKKTKELLIDAQQNKRFTKKSKHVLNKKFKLSNHVKQIINVYKELTSHF